MIVFKLRINRNLAVFPPVQCKRSKEYEIEGSGAEKFETFSSPKFSLKFLQPTGRKNIPFSWIRQRGKNGEQTRGYRLHKSINSRDYALLEPSKPSYTKS